MKAYKYLFATVVLAMACSCNGFLEYRDKDKVIPQTLDQYNELIAGELLLKGTSATLLTLEFMADDFSSFCVTGSSSSRRDERLLRQNYYIWAKEPQVNDTGDEMIDPAWETFYQKILMCNIIERDVLLISTKDSDEVATQKQMLAEVQCVRAICYYFLANIYGEVYQSAAQADQAMGVPINNETSIYTKTYERSTLAEVCKKIEEDLNNAEANFKLGEHKTTIFRPNADLVLLMKSRLYLMMHRYDEVITVCDALLGSTSRMIAPASFVQISVSSKPFLRADNPGILFSWWLRDGLYSSSNDGRYVTSQELVESYVNDFRADAFFGPDTYRPRYKMDQRNKWTTYSTCMAANFRIEEAYFNKAEAMLKKTPASYANALSIVNQVRAQRITAAGNLLTASSADAAWTVFKAEKRREFCFEDMRWFDIRRWGERITRKYQDFNNPNEYETYVLESNSPNYVMSLPFDVIRLNDKIEKAKRVDSKPIPNE